MAYSYQRFRSICNPRFQHILTLLLPLPGEHLTPCPYYHLTNLSMVVIKGSYHHEIILSRWRLGDLGVGYMGPPISTACFLDEDYDDSKESLARNETKLRFVSCSMSRLKHPLAYSQYKNVSYGQVLPRNLWPRAPTPSDRHQP